jgi:hypothetical protein
MPYSAASRVRVCRENRDVVERLMLADVAVTELLLGERLACRVPDPADGAGLGHRERRGGRRVLLQDDGNCIDGGAQDLGGAPDRVGALPNEFMQTGDVDEGRVRAGEVEVAQETERRAPGDRLVSAPVPGEETAGGLVQCRGELGVRMAAERAVSARK